MWTPKIESVEKVKDQISIIVSFTSDIDGEESFNKEFSANNLNQLKQFIQNKIDEVLSKFKFADDLSKLIGKPFDTTIIKDPPTSEELARQKYFSDLAVLNIMIENIKDGIRKDTDQAYLDQLALVKSEFLPEYEKLV